MQFYAKNTENPVDALPAATVIPLRETRDGFEVLLIHRNPEIAFQGDMWAFPGGRIETDDYVNGDGDILTAARQASIREAREEAGIYILADGLVMLSRWTTPQFQPKRYQTWFFVGTTNDQHVCIDGSEIIDYRWMKPEEALNVQRDGEIAMMPPTFVSLEKLSCHESIESVFSALEEETPEDFLPIIKKVPGGFCSLYHTDAAYEGGDINQPGRRHRFWGLNTGWRYERSELIG